MNIIRTLLYCHCASSSIDTVKTVYTFRLSLNEFVFLCFFRLHDLSVCFYMDSGQLSHFPSCFGAGVTTFNEPPSSFLLPLNTVG